MSTTTPRTVKAPDVRRAEILRAARHLFAELGVGRTSFAEIAEHVGITRGLVYHYFADKDAVVDAVVDEYLAEIVDDIRAWDAARTPGDIDGALAGAVALFRRHLSPAAEAPRIEDTRRYHHVVDRAVDAMVACLQVTTVEAYARRHRIEIEHVPQTFAVLIHGLIGLLRAHPETDDAALAAIVRQTLRLAPSAGSAGPSERQ